MIFNTDDSFRNAIDIVTEAETLGDIIEKKRKYFNDHERIKRINQEIDERKERIKILNEKFKNENYDSMTRMKYRRFRTDFHTKYKSILCNRDTEINKLEKKLNSDLNRINLIPDVSQRKRAVFNTKRKFYENKEKIHGKYKNIIKEFALDYRYRVATVGLKWCYIAVEELDI